MTAIENHLIPRARLFAVDLPGFGASERREDLSSPPAMGEFLAQLMAQAELGRAHLVAPDVGTSAALFAAASLPASRLVIIDAGHFVWEEEPAQYASAILDSITASRS